MNDHEKELQTIQQFIDKAQLEMTAKRIPGRNDIHHDTWSKDARHFVCEIKRVGFGHRDPMIVFFSQGSGHKKPPTLEDVLDCLASDVASIDGMPLDDWADEMGYRCHECGGLGPAKEIYRAIEEQREGLLMLLDADLLEELMYDVERL